MSSGPKSNKSFDYNAFKTELRHKLKEKYPSISKSEFEHKYKKAIKMKIILMADAEFLSNSEDDVVLETLPPILTKAWLSTVSSQKISSPINSVTSSPRIPTQHLEDDYSDTCQGVDFNNL